MTLNKRAKIRYPEAVEEARKLVAVGADREFVLLFMRHRGFDQADCVYSYQALYETSFREAKNAIMLSKAWSDKLESNITLQKVAREALRLLAKHDSPGFKIDFIEEE